MSDNNNDWPAMPMQPIHVAPDGYVRFAANRLVRHLLDEATAGRKCDMNALAWVEVTQSERMQFAQLIGYSISGYGELSYVTDESYDAAWKAAQRMTP